MSVTQAKLEEIKASMFHCSYHFAISDKLCHPARGFFVAADVASSCKCNVLAFKNSKGKLIFTHQQSLTW